MIATLIKPDEGQIIFQGEDIRKNPRILREKLGYVPQEIALYESVSGLENPPSSTQMLSQTLSTSSIRCPT